MSSEFEIVEEDAVAQSNVRELAAVNGGNSNNGIAVVGEDSLKNDVYTAAAYGDLEKLQRLVESEGCSVSVPDSIGYYALQWAALNNRTAAAQYIIEHGGDVNAVDHTGQTALHWTAVRGAIQVAELLLKEGARVNAADMYGYQTTHVAAQYGQTAFLYHIVSKWNADPDVPDFDGRSPLHWAAYKGFADSIHLLLFLDSYRGRQDREGCTPLHWGAIRGNLEACTVLVEAGKKEDLMVTDNTGLTPAQLASDKNNRQVAIFLLQRFSQSPPSQRYNPVNRNGSNGNPNNEHAGRIPIWANESNFDPYVCQICGKKNHMALDCFHRYDYNYQGRHPPQQLAAMVAQSNSIHEDNTWYADSGANQHITGDIANLQLAEPYAGDDKVAVGNGQPLGTHVADRQE